VAVFCSQPARVGNEDSGIGGGLKCMLLRIRADLTDSTNSENKGNFPSYLSACTIDRFAEHTF